MVFRTSRITLTVLASSTLLLSGCQSGQSEVEVENAWAKATDSGMTGVFADITNSGSGDVTMIAASSDAAQMVELHEIVGGVMQEKEGGMLVAAGQTYTLAPGGDHIMLMGLSEPLLAGDTVTVTVELDNGETVVIEASVRDYQGANEEYVGEGESGHGQMEQMGQE